MRPFWSNQLQAVAVDEICACGHLKTEHGGTNIPMTGTKAVLTAKGEGSCCCDDCSCSHYEFARFIGKDEQTEMLKARCETHSPVASRK